MKKNINQILTVIFAVTVCLAFSGCIGVFDAGTDSHEKQEHEDQEFLNSGMDSKDQRQQSQATEIKEDFFIPIGGLSQLTDDVSTGNQKLLGLEVDANQEPLIFTSTGAFYCPNGKCQYFGLSDRRSENYAFCKNKELLALGFKNKILINNYARPGFQKKLNDLQENISTLSFALDCDSLFIGTVSGRVYHWKFLQSDNDINNPWLTAYQGHSAVVNNILMHNASRLFFSLDWSGNFFAWLTYENSADNLREKDNPFWPRFWLENASRMKKKLNSPAEGFFQSPDGQQLLIHTKAGNLQLWQVRGFKMQCETKADFKVKKLKASDNFERLIVTDSLDRLYQAKIYAPLVGETANSDCQFETKTISLDSDSPIKALALSGDDSLWLWQDKLQKIKFK